MGIFAPSANLQALIKALNEAFQKKNVDKTYQDRTYFDPGTSLYDASVHFKSHPTSGGFPAARWKRFLTRVMPQEIHEAIRAAMLRCAELKRPMTFDHAPLAQDGPMHIEIFNIDDPQGTTYGKFRLHTYEEPLAFKAARRAKRR